MQGEMFEDTMYLIDSVFDLEAKQVQFVRCLNLENENVSDKVLLDEQTFTDYFDILLLRKENNVCSITSSIVLDYFIIIDLFKLSYQIPETIFSHINLCKILPIYQDFYVIPLKLHIDIREAHSNVMIVNMKENTVEYFEPHGMMINADESGYNMSAIVGQIIQKLFPMHDLKVKNVSSQCPIGPQIAQGFVNPNSGHCLAWSLLFVHMRLINLHIKPELVINYFSKFDPSRLDILIRKYISKLERESLFFPPKQYDKVRSYAIHFSPDEDKVITKQIGTLSKIIVDNKHNEADRKKHLKQLLLYNSYPLFYDIFFKNVNVE
jgi:hypothetical protein